VKNVTFWTGVLEPGRRRRLLSRELIYSALTRFKDRLILLLEGGDSSFLHELIRTSEAARRSTNLFAVAFDGGNNVDVVAQNVAMRGPAAAQGIAMSFF
jgi:hypothetical protein